MAGLFKKTFKDAGPFHYPKGSLAKDDYDVLLTPKIAGWYGAGLRVVTIAPGKPFVFSTRKEEIAVVPLEGGCVITLDSETYELQGRKNVFSAPTEWMYVSIDSTITVTVSQPAKLAIASASASVSNPPQKVTADKVPIEVRGAGSCTRQVNNIMTPDTFPGAERLICVEVLTPRGNWSSYPPHKHDGSEGCTVNNEELFYFLLDGELPEAGFGVHCLYTNEAGITEMAMVRKDDLFCIPRGYHGPSIASPGYDLYYLNVLSGKPGSERTMAFCDDPLHQHIRGLWETQEPDPRCPLY